MMDLTQHAMETFDATERFTMDDAFIPSGFLVLPQPFYCKDIHDLKMAVRAFLWRVDEAGAVITGEDEHGRATTYTFNMNADGLRTEPTLRITSLSHVDDPDDYTDEMAEMLARLRTKNWQWGIVHTTVIPFGAINNVKDVGGEGDAQAGWLKFWRTTQRLMSERIVTSERRQAGRPARREAARQGYDFGAPRVIELRRPRGKEADPENERLNDVNWTHRWIVRGHWRQQWYPSISGHRQRWIGAYEKGPDDLPLVIRERVWNWDR